MDHTVVCIWFLLHEFSSNSMLLLKPISKLPSMSPMRELDRSKCLSEWWHSSCRSLTELWWRRRTTGPRWTADKHKRENISVCLSVCMCMRGCVCRQSTCVAEVACNSKKNGHKFTSAKFCRFLYFKEYFLYLVQLSIFLLVLWKYSHQTNAHSKLHNINALYLKQNSKMFHK